MLSELNKEQQALAEFMSQISETALAAGWMSGLEFKLWDVLHGGSRQYGNYIITENEVAKLQSLFDKCGCWIIFDDENEETAVELKAWLEIYHSRGAW